MADALDLSVVVRARLDLESRRVDAVEQLATDGPAAGLVEALAGDRLRAIVANQRAAFAHRDPATLTFAKVATLQRSTDRVTSEGLDLALGAIARDLGLDAGACSQADRFVAWLAAKADRRFARMCVPSDEESVHRSVDVIRRRVPDHGLWDLPVMAHELGHLVAGGLTRWDTQGDVIAAPVAAALAEVDEAARSRATELFCDIFAAYAVGPSFLCTQVFHRLDPTAPGHTSSGATHPSDATRILATQLTLNRMRSGNGPHGFDSQLYWARVAWQQMQSAASADSVLTREQQRAVLTEVARWMAILARDLSGFAYTWSPIVDKIVRHVRNPLDEPPPAGCSPADVLNAAWLLRLGDWFDGRPAPTKYEASLNDLLAASLDPSTQGR